MLLDQVLNVLVTAVEAVISWWSVVMNRTGMNTLYIVIMSVVLSMGILLKPILGHARSGLDAGSDKVGKWISGKDEELHKL